MHKSGIDAIIFDLNGVLANAESWHERSFIRAMEDFGYEVEPNLKKKGYSTIGRLRELSKMGRAPQDINQVLAAKRAYAKELVKKECKPIHRVLEAVSYAYIITEGKIAIATNCSEETARDMLFYSGLYKFFNIIITSDDIEEEKMKPHPKPFLEASYRLDVYSKRCLAIDDSDIGILSAVEAMCRTLRIRNFEDLSADLIEKKLKALEIRI